MTGGPNLVCRFYGNANINPATGAIYGPNSHFYTADANECAGPRALYAPTTKSWKFAHVSAQGPLSYDDESVLCHAEVDCSTSSENYPVWTSRYATDSAMEAAIERAHKKTMAPYARHFPHTYWTVDLVERQMPFCTRTGCNVATNPYPPAGTNDASDCFGLLRTNIIAYIQGNDPRYGGVQTNSLGANPAEYATHPVWQQSARAAQTSAGGAGLFAGLQAGQPSSFYRAADATAAQFQQDARQAVNWAKQMLPGHPPVRFIEFWDNDIANPFASTVPPMRLNTPPSALNDAAGGYLQVPLTDAHNNLKQGEERPLSNNATGRKSSLTDLSPTGQKNG